jgi:hypothetical protein
MFSLQFQKLRMAQFYKERRILFPVLISVLAFTSVLLVASCQSSETAKPELTPSTTIPSDFQLVIGEGGGFTGQWRGYIVDSAGMVSTWTGTSPEQNVKRSAELARRQFDKLWQLIANSRFFETDSTGTGNMTVALQVTANGKVHRTSWAKPSGTRSPLAPVQVLYDSCRTIVSRGK